MEHYILNHNLKTPNRIILAIPVMSAKRTGMTKRFLCDNGKWYLPHELARVWRVRWETIKKRIKAYGMGSDLLPYNKGRIPKALSDAAKKGCAKSPVVEKEMWKAEAKRAPDGCLLTRDNRKLVANTEFEDKFFELPPAATGPCKHTATESTPAVMGITKTRCYKAKELLKKYNIKMTRRGFLRDGNFTNTMQGPQMDAAVGCGFKKLSLLLEVQQYQNCYKEEN